MTPHDLAVDLFSNPLHMAALIMSVMIGAIVADILKTFRR